VSDLQIPNPMVFLVVQQASLVPFLNVTPQAHHIYSYFLSGGYP
jgi:hypothetical protein